tara:strand:- start:660 stop:782 length:123 start_codon:yes stop_codon:yes gene_type:complete
MLTGTQGGGAEAGAAAKQHGDTAVVAGGRDFRGDTAQVAG